MKEEDGVSKNVTHWHRCLFLLWNFQPYIRFTKHVSLWTVINEMEKNVQESLLLSEIIFTSIVPLAMTVSSPEFRKSELFFHLIKSKNNKNKTITTTGRKYLTIMELYFYVF